MIRERIADNIYWFQSELYAQVTAGAIIGPDWAILVDTLAIPDETLEMRAFIEEKLGVQVRYIINTIYHADHTFGNYFFPGATVISHVLAREKILEKNQQTLENAQEQEPAFKRINKIVVPDITIDKGTLSLQIGKRNVSVYPTPGSSPDGISVLIKEDRVLFAGDAFLPLPNIIEGDVEQLTNTIRLISKLGLENIVQGHGDVILRGEIENAAQSNIDYLAKILKVARTAVKHKDPREVIEAATVDQCGKSRVLLTGLVVELHQQNLIALYQREKLALEK
ncbi:MAG: MBL fold metallo-hydrolase [Pelolinea sp.]|nr:MBL fold metallo-hydrolase [Pelolinea sp.]